ncbi:MAG: pyridoxamine kinase [Candidatus Fimenecus sp.]
MKKIAVVNDISGFGRCSMTAALPVLSVLKTECCPLPTAILSNQTGYDSFYCDDFTDRIDPYLAEWRKLGVRFDGILTGYLASAKQADKILRFLDEFKTANTLYVCDPVMADDGTVYDTYDSALCAKIAELARRANVLTPNLTELCLLTNTDFAALQAQNVCANYTEQIARLAASLLSNTLHTVVVTGVCVGDAIYNVAVQQDGFSVVKSKRFGGSFSGTGDLFSAVLAGSLVNGETVEHAVQKAVQFLEASIKDSFTEGTNRNDGVNYQKYLEMLLK